tara:strand:- start:60 stop:2459 length:2400 start_codon:yes stop_codon:yes gene_type:complete
MSRAFAPHHITDDSALGGAVIENGVRFKHHGVVSKMYRTGNTTSSTYTFSVWFKYTAQENNSYNVIISYPNSSGQASVSIDNNHKMYFDGGNSTSRNNTTRFFRDPAAWYHLTYSVNSNNYTAYINGESFKTGTVRSLDTSSQGIRLGCLYDNYYPWEGYFADFHLVTEQALLPTDFAYTDSLTGIWRPKRYTGTYGTGGSHLEFKDSSALGKDTSGNGNDFTVVNVTANDHMKESPTNSFCIGNTINRGYYTTPTRGALKFAGGSGNDTVTGTIGVDPNRNANGYYWEIRVTGTQSNNRGFFGIGQDVNIGEAQDARGGDTKSWVLRNGDGALLHNGSSASNTGVLSANDKIMIAVKGNSIWWGKNGTWFNSGNPATGTNPAYTNVNVPWVPAIDLMTNVGATFNFGQDSSFDGTETAQTNKDASGLGTFYYTVPSGFKALHTKNVTIESSTIYNAKKHFNCVTWTGDTNGSKDITGVGFTPDLVSIKSRTNTYEFLWFDSVRGAAKRLFSHNDSNESENLATLNGFITDGFRLGNGSAADLSVSGSASNNYVAWCWKAGGAAVTNTDGTLSSSVSVNKDARFSIVSWTSAGVTGSTIGHGLGIKPDVIFLKGRNVSSNQPWRVYHSALGATKSLQLQSDAAPATQTGVWNDTEPTSSVFTVGSFGSTNENTKNYIAYCWTSVPGYSKFGSYVGTGAQPGTFLDLGFKPAMIIVKRNATEDWVIVDFKRTSNDEGNPRQLYLRVSGNNVEGSGVVYDLTSNGVRFNNTSQNESGQTYYYFAWADEVGTTPFGSQVTAG